MTVWSVNKLTLEFRSKPKSHLRGEKVICSRCDKFYRDVGEVDVKTVDGARIESEFIPLCSKCFKKMIKKEYKRQFLTNAVNDQIIGKFELEKYTKHEVSEELFSELVNRGNIKKTKTIQLINSLRGNKSYAKCRMFLKIKKKYDITNKEIGDLIVKAVKKNSK